MIEINDRNASNIQKTKWRDLLHITLNCPNYVPKYCFKIKSMFWKTRRIKSSVTNLLAL